MSKLEFYKSNEEFDIWRFTPDIFHAFPFYMEHVRLPWRIRCVMEFFVGYQVFYIKKSDKWAGYCVISNGRNKRYNFSTEKDIIYGRYFISNEFRGNGLAVRMLKEILDNCDLDYQKAFAYLKLANTASVKTMERIGAKAVKRFEIKGLLRHLYENTDGDYVLYEYVKGR